MKRRLLDIAIAILVHRATWIVGFLLVSLWVWRFDVVKTASFVAIWMAVVFVCAVLAKLWRRLVPEKKQADDDAPAEPVSLRDD